MSTLDKHWKEWKTLLWEKGESIQTLTFKRYWDQHPDYVISVTIQQASREAQASVSARKEHRYKLDPLLVTPMNVDEAMTRHELRALEDYYRTLPDVLPSTTFQYQSSQQLVAA